MAGVTKGVRAWPAPVAIRSGKKVLDVVADKMVDRAYLDRQLERGVGER